jgi:hypothetical protein
MFSLKPIGCPITVHHEQAARVKIFALSVKTLGI